MLISAQYIADIKQIIVSARAKAYTAVNSAMLEAYWLIGKRIVEEEQHGKNRAEYGKEILKNLSVELKREFGEGFGERNLRNFRQFYMTFKDTEFGTQCMPNLSWSHIKLIMRLTDKNAMQYYLLRRDKKTRKRIVSRDAFPGTMERVCFLHKPYTI
jgi:hypothetical protein